MELGVNKLWTDLRWNILCRFVDNLRDQKNSVTIEFDPGPEFTVLGFHL